jgi:Predicted nucleic acid-binding protein, contains PIN domain
VIHLDTNFLVALEDEQSPETARITRWIQQNRDVRVSAVAWAEFLCGPVGDTTIMEALLPSPVPFEAKDAAKAATLFNATGRRSRSLQDCMIAAAAILADAELATSDMKDFRRFAKFGLRIAE